MPHASRPFQRLALVALAIAALGGCGTNGPATGVSRLGADASAQSRTQSTRFIASNVLYRVDKNVRLMLDSLDADVDLKGSGPFSPADKDTYSIAIRTADVRQEPASLAALLNTYVFGDAGSPLKDLKVGIKGNKMVLSGKLKKVIWLGFEMKGDLTATPDGRVRMTPSEISSMGIPVNGLMEFVGMDLTNLLKARQSKGMVIEGNDIVLDPSKMFPPPRLLGKVAAVKLDGGMLNYSFRDGAPRALPAMPVKTKNYLALWGGPVKINAVTSDDAKIQLVDADPSDPFAYALDFCRESLEAGYVVVGKDGTLAGYVPDANTWSPDFGRYAPSFPAPGIKEPKSDMPPFKGSAE